MTIVITLPYFFKGETERIIELLDTRDVALVHIRKLAINEEEWQKHPSIRNAEVRKKTKELLESFPAEYRKKLVLHDDHDLANEYQLHGIHLNSRNPLPPEGWSGSISRSCHSIEEVKEWKRKCNYVTLSPIYDSISKKGYKSAFTKEEILRASKVGIIDEKVLALGGVTFEKAKEVKNMGFGGAMILGDAWK